MAKAAPEDNPKSMVAMAMATSKCLEAPTMAASVPCSHRLYYLLKQDSMLTILLQPVGRRIHHSRIRGEMRSFN